MKDPILWDEIVTLRRALETCGWHLSNLNRGKKDGFNAASRAVEGALGKFTNQCQPSREHLP